ncbi:hypothetical protein BUY12_02310 [Staphylococcus chromogenes]|uniref:hypothetical protein n=1 Tax=Staphylococcus chromogenes TaxID=46126 RepID=UPI000D1C241B|nr:hypothetical protein [Staphylococcus chromogenes]PTF52295.1 hypothetical protein BUY12_02310 [Staphylococcus chromogenes]
MNNQEEILNLFKDVEQGNSIFVNEEELKTCKELRDQGKIDFKYSSVLGSSKEEIELVDPIFHR